MLIAKDPPQGFIHATWEYCHRMVSPPFSGHRWAAWGYRLIQFSLAGLFLYSGIAKSLDLSQFAVLIEAYGLIPEATVYPVALILALLELLSGLGLFLDLEWSLELVTGLLALFMMILGYGIWMGLDVDCGCFGPEDPEARAFHGLWPALYRDAVMVAGAGFIYFWRWRGPVRPRKISMVFKPILNLNS